ncbi:gluconolactonase [Actinobacillus succinogenes]|uniref:SMP-30/Gluconolaconase/LRE domain protein n=1 Tax=Actinobacillus succinogenes (strain ATCC 55618 / DSM 22257 / CCUG 43843 / 130Z) TaxID=339671 RepID=A6VQF8_ACTSZ|nr:SMP-30/gluconolactonase/LRE family protein [Actinobacillus succinogenes]ABR75205.1 SMP-30/Gluconolaconase/LRE domain protein [Actinobacillus succinogenes 130Z]PHI40401.1 gluconolactonase [Actinobacillus succinogenes]
MNDTNQPTVMHYDSAIDRSRRNVLRTIIGGTLLSVTGMSFARANQNFTDEAVLSPRYPDPLIEVLDPSFNQYRLYSASVERLATGFRWAEGPVWFGDSQCLLFSDIPNNRIMRYDQISGQTTVFREHANYSNGLARDKQGRLLACEHLTRRLTRTEYDGSITVLADRFDGKPLNSPNDIAVQSNGVIWFTDPAFGINGHYEGEKAKAEQPTAVYRIAPETEKLERVLDDLLMPNGIAFSPDEKYLYIVGRFSETPNQREIFRYNVQANGTLSNKSHFFDGGENGTLDGLAIDEDGNIWAGWGSITNSKNASSADMDGVIVINPQGKQIAHIHLPERCANLCFGGPKRNRVFMASGHSLYALYVETRGA